MREVQTLTTSTYSGANEIQSVTTSATAIQEVQSISVTTTKVAEVQTVVVTGATGGSFFLMLDTTSSGGSLQYSGDIFISYPVSGTTTGLDVQSIIQSMSNVLSPVTVTLDTSNPTVGKYSYVITFPVTMGDVPQMTVIFSSLTPVYDVNVVVGTKVNGNVVGGLFRLSFEGQTTSSLSFDASENDVRVALETLPSIGTVQVSRNVPTPQLEYIWLVTFTSGVNSGSQPKIVPDFTGLTVSSAAAGTIARIDVVITIPGNQIGGSFVLSFTSKAAPPVTANSGLIKHDATAEEFQKALGQAFVGGAVSVSRAGPDGQMGYIWSISFLETISRITEGPQNPFIYTPSALLTGTGAVVTVVNVRTGTVKEKQTITVTNTNSALNYYMYLNYNGQTTAGIALKPYATSCITPITEVQTITSSTVDTSAYGGDNDVSINLQMRIKYGNEVTALISTTNCATAAAAISTALEMFSVFSTVSVTGVATGSTASQSACIWTLSFVGSIGNLDLLQVESYNSVTGSIGSLGVSSVAGDDTLQTAIMTVGQKDTIKAALEMLTNVGTVTVSAASATPVSGTCTFLVTFDTSVGSLTLMNVFVYDFAASPAVTVVPASTSSLSGIMVGITRLAANQGTGAKIGGNFALSFRGVRSVYLSYDVTASALQIALQALNTIGMVDVIRSVSDENNGYTWTVTFLTELGSLDMLQFDGVDMTGTVVTGLVAKATTGVSPLFNSLSVINGLPLGSAPVTDMSNLALLVSNLDQGIAYYFRVAAINAVGRGPYGLAATPYAVPLLRQPGMPIVPTLTVVDGTSLTVAFQPPVLDGGANVNNYKVNDC